MTTRRLSMCAAACVLCVIIAGVFRDGVLSESRANGTAFAPCDTPRWVWDAKLELVSGWEYGVLYVLQRDGVLRKVANNARLSPCDLLALNPMPIAAVQPAGRTLQENR